MRKPARVVFGIIFAAGIFSAGYMANRHPLPAGSSDSARQATTYSCPMHPQYTLDHAGDCPICGMRLEPVAATGSGTPTGSAVMPGMVAIGASRQQQIGLRTDEVRHDTSSQVLRFPGRVAVDEQRQHRIIAAADGWILDLRENTVGRFVRKDQLLATYYTRDLLYSERLFLLSIPDNQQLQPQTRTFSQASIRTAGSANPEFPIDTLRSLGMSDLQIVDIQKTRTASPHVNIYSPVSGFVLERNVSPSQRFDKGAELYRIADISRVWVLADIFEKDREFLKPGAEATILSRGRRFRARMSDALPRFDAQSRTLKTRFELDNPESFLQPDMFVDVELHVEMPPAITVPADALFDSGLRKTVFVDRGNGNFEARRVETGWRLGDRVEVVKGLMEGERIVAAATFLLDSESRMKAAVAGIFDPETDPVCGMDVDRDRARQAGRTTRYQDVDYYFCSDDCKKKFEGDPAKYLDGHEPRRMEATPHAPASPSKADGATARAISQATAAPAQATDPVCGMDVNVADAVAAGRVSALEGQRHYFCSDNCKKKFDADPAKYLGGHEPRRMEATPHAPASPSKADGATARTISQTAAAPARATDPVCGMDVNVADAVAAGRVSALEGQRYYFCSDNCKQKFDAKPGEYLKK